MSGYHMAIFQFDSELRVRQRFDNGAFHFYVIFFRHHTTNGLCFKEFLSDFLGSLGEPVEAELPWIVAQATPDRWIANATIAADLAVLDGHYPGNPIVPGVAQVHWAALAARAAFDVEVSGNLETIKFRRPIVPGTRLTLTLTLDHPGGKVGFEFADADQVYSSGRLLLEPS